MPRARSRGRTALRFVTDSGRDGAIAARDSATRNSADLPNDSLGYCARSAINKGNRVFTIMGRCPELYIAMLGALRNGCIVSPLFSAFGPEPIATRIDIGQADVLVTTRTIYQRKIAKIRDRLRSVRHIFVVDEGKAGDLPAGTLDFWHRMNAADENTPIEPTTAEDPALLHFTSGTTGTPKGAIHVHGAVAMHYVTGLYALDLHPDDIYWCTADPGWVTGTSYGIISPLLHGVTSIVDEAEFDAERWYRDSAGPEACRSGTRRRLQSDADQSRAPNCRAIQFSAASFHSERRRTAQPGSGLVGKAGARLANSRQLVADRDGRHHDREYPGIRHQAWLDGPTSTRR